MATAVLQPRPVRSFMSQPQPVHVPVMLDEVLAWLNPQPGQTIVDGTLGAGGHTQALSQRVGSAGLVISFDRDPAALDAAERNLAGRSIKLVHSDFRDLAAVLRQLELEQVDAVLLDLGLSSDQLADSERGFSFDAAGPLDLRFDTTTGTPAWQLLEKLTAERLADIIYQYGEERFSRRIARKIVERRQSQPVRTATDLADLVRRCVPRSRDSERIDPATRTFQALRIAVNDELGSLEQVLRDLPRCVRPGGRVAIISFHSLEDRLVKESFRSDDRWRVLTNKPLRATDGEVARNPRSRSAKLRIAERVG